MAKRFLSIRSKPMTNYPTFYPDTGYFFCTNTLEIIDRTVLKLVDIVALNQNLNIIILCISCRSESSLGGARGR